MFKDTFKRLVQVPGVSGYEERVREEISEMVGGEADRFGNLILKKEGGKVLLVAHMDEVGLVVSHIEDDGRVRFRKVGGIDDRILPSSHVTVHTEKGDVPGVIGIMPPHLQVEEERKVLSWRELYIDVGASSREEVEELGVQVLDQVTFMRPWAELNRGRRIATKNVDDRYGCALLVELAKDEKALFAWTAQEEVGLRGAWAMASNMDVELVIAVDTCSCCDPVITGPLELGKGPIIRAFDNASIADRRLVKRVLKLAKENGIPVQLATTGGGTDMALFQRFGLKALSLGVPIKYSHSLTEMIDLEDVRHLEELLRLVISEFP